MSKKMLAVGLVVLVGVIALSALPGQASAAGRGSSGSSTCETGECTGTVDGSGSGYMGGRVSGGSVLRGGRSGLQGQGEIESGSGAFGKGQSGNGESGTCDECSGTEAVGTLTEAEVNALTALLEDEYKARALYEQAIADLGSVRPFTQLVRAEARHIASLEKQFVHFGLDIPTVEVEDLNMTFATQAEACAAGVEAEKANAALYDEWLAQVDNANLIRVLTRLQSASLNQHLPALEACAQ